MVCNDNCGRCVVQDVCCLGKNRASWIVEVPKEMLLPSVNKDRQTTVHYPMPVRKHADPPTSVYRGIPFPGGAANRQVSANVNRALQRSVSFSLVDENPEPDWNACQNLKGSMACLHCAFCKICQKKPKVKIVGLESPRKPDWRDRLPEIFSEIGWQGVDW